VLHAGVMSRICKQYTVADTDGAEDSPAIHEAHLPRRNQLVGSPANMAVVEEVCVHTRSLSNLRCLGIGCQLSQYQA
jgi:hypothetical protein